MCFLPSAFALSPAALSLVGVEGRGCSSVDGHTLIISFKVSCCSIRLEYMELNNVAQCYKAIR